MGQRAVDASTLQLEEEQQDIVLDDYQREGAQYLRKHLKSFLGLPMGAGKTRVALLADQNIRADLDSANNIAPRTPTLVICPRSAFLQWKLELQKYWPDHYRSYEDAVCYIRGQKWERHHQWRNCRGARLVVATYAAVRLDRHVISPYWTVIVLDEAHYVRTHKTQIFNALKQLSSHAMFAVTGTPASSGPQDMWPMLNILRPNRYPSYWRYINTWCHVEDNMWGGRDIVCPKNPENFKKAVMARDLFFIARSDLKGILPDKTRRQANVEMTPLQAKLYAQLDSEMWAEINSGELLITSTILGKITQLRKILCSPKIVDPDCPENGGGIDYILDTLQGEAHTTIFVPFRAAIPVLKTAILDRFPKYTVEYLQGGMEPEEIGERVTRFKERRGVMICTISFAQSFDLETCSLGIFLGQDMDPLKNFQAEDRIARRNSIGPVTLMYISHPGTYDEDAFGILGKKAYNVKQILSTPKSIMKFLQSHRLKSDS